MVGVAFVTMEQQQRAGRQQHQEVPESSACGLNQPPPTSDRVSSALRLWRRQQQQEVPDGPVCGRRPKRPLPIFGCVLLSVLYLEQQRRHGAHENGEMVMTRKHRQAQGMDVLQHRFDPTDQRGGA